MLKTLLPRTRAQLSSSINGDIKVVEYFNGPCVWVGDTQQSGPYIKKFWEKIFSEVSLKETKNILILGFGAGSAYNVIRSLNDKVKVTGIELDPLMIQVAKQYFGVNESKITKLVVADANKFLKTTKTNFDLIILDIYFGPNSQLNKNLITASGKHLKKHGSLLINSYQQNINESQLLPKSLKKVNSIQFKKNILQVVNSATI